MDVLGRKKNGYRSLKQPSDKIVFHSSQRSWSICERGVRNLLVDCDAGLEGGVLLRRMSHEDHVDAVEGPRFHQVDLSSYFLLGRGSQNGYLGSCRGGLVLAFGCKNITATHYEQVQDGDAENIYAAQFLRTRFLFCVPLNELLQLGRAVTFT